MVQTHSVGGEINEATRTYSDNSYVYFAKIKYWLAILS